MGRATEPVLIAAMVRGNCPGGCESFERERGQSAVVAHFFVSAIGRTLARAGDSTRFSAALSTFSHRKERDPITARASTTRAGRCTLSPDLDDADRSTLNTAPEHDLLSHSGHTIPAYRSLCMRRDLEEGGIDSFAPCVGSERTIESTRASFQNYRIGDCPDRATDRPRGNHKGALLNALRNEVCYGADCRRSVRLMDLCLCRGS